MSEEDKNTTEGLNDISALSDTKYNSVEDLVKGYNELQRMLSSKPPEPKPQKTPSSLTGKAEGYSNKLISMGLDQASADSFVDRIYKDTAEVSVKNKAQEIEEFLGDETNKKNLRAYLDRYNKDPVEFVEHVESGKYKLKTIKNMVEEGKLGSVKESTGTVSLDLAGSTEKMDPAVAEKRRNEIRLSPHFYNEDSPRYERLRAEEKELSKHLKL